MLENILFLLWALIVPFLTVAHQFLKLYHIHRKQPLLEIIFVTLLMAFVWAIIGCGWGMMLLSAASDSLILRCALGNVVFSGITLLYLGTKSFPRLFKKLLFAFFALFNLSTVFIGLIGYPFSAVIFIVVLITYPMMAVYHFLLSYIAKEIT